MDTRELDILPLRVSGYLARDPGVFKHDPNPAKIVNLAWRGT